MTGPSSCPDHCDCPEWDKGHRVVVLAEKLAAALSRAEKAEALLNGGMRDRARAAEERARKLEEALRPLEWCRDAAWADGCESMCPECDQIPMYGHAPDCRIGMLLAPPPEAEKKGGE